MSTARVFLAQVTLLAAVAIVLAGCGLLGGSSVSSASCENMSGGACDEQVELVSTRHPGATAVDLRCTAPVCDRRGGRGTAVVTMRDGTRVDDAFAYAGDPAPLPVPTCTGLPVDVCRRVAAGEADSIAPSRSIVAMSVVCSSAPCVAAGGEATVTITLGDGSVEQRQSGWEGGQP